MCVSRLSGLRYCDDHTVLRVGRPAWPPFLILLSEKKAKKASQACQSKGLLHSTQAWEQLDSSTRESIRSYSDYVLHVELLCVPMYSMLLSYGGGAQCWGLGCWESQRQGDDLCSSEFAGQTFNGLAWHERLCGRSKKKEKKEKRGETNRRIESAAATSFYSPLLIEFELTLYIYC